MNSLASQRGAAIIVVLFVVALVTMLAAIMMERLQTDIRRTELLLNANQAYLYAQGSVTWAIDQLNNDWKQQKPNQIIDKTPIYSPKNKENNFTISSVIYDAQGYFNVNNVIDQLYQPNFTRLIQILDPTIEAPIAQSITQAIIDWISPTSANPALEEYYLQLTPPYRSPHRPMVHASELRLVKGITKELFAKISPFITALPQTTTININNASIPVLMCLTPSMTLESAKAIEVYRQQAPFSSTQKFQEFDVVKNNPIDSNKLTVISNYFLLQTNVTVSQQHLVLYTMLERSVKDSQSTVIVLWQSKGTL